MLDMPSEECGVCVWFLLLHSGALHTNDQDGLCPCLVSTHVQQLSRSGQVI